MKWVLRKTARTQFNGPRGFCLTDDAIKRLYEKKGALLKKKGEEISSKADKNLTNFHQQHFTSNSVFLSPEIKRKILQLQERKIIDLSQIPASRMGEDGANKVNELAMDLLTYGLTWTRLEGRPLVLDEEFRGKFTEIKPNWKEITLEKFFKTSRLLLEAGLIRGSFQNGFWFENQEDSLDIQKLLLLADRNGKILLDATERARIKWSGERIETLLTFLIEQQLLVRDNDQKDTYWFMK